MGLRFSVVRHQQNLGGGAARNTAVRNVDAENIFCLDSDNLIEPKFFAKGLQTLVDGGHPVVAFAEIAYFGPRRSHAKSWIFKAPTASIVDAPCDVRIPPASSGNFFFARTAWDAVGGYPEALGSLDAFGFSFRLLARFGEIAVAPNSKYFHRLGHDSYWVRDQMRNHGWTELRAEILERLDLPHV